MLDAQKVACDLKAWTSALDVSTRRMLEQLATPPIVEVVCGVQFSELADLDPLFVGTYWNERRADFPKRQLHPALQDKLMFHLQAVGPLRSWFLSADESFVVQIQPDRFYLNWRARAGEYPRFNDHNGRSGLLTHFLAELQMFSAFCLRNAGNMPIVSSITLSKIDHLVRGAHWADFADLATCVPWMNVFSQVSNSADPMLGLRFKESDNDVVLSVSVDTAIVPKEPRPEQIVKIETTASKSLGNVSATDREAMREAFTRANSVVNGIFEKMIPLSEREKRFSGEVRQ